MTFRFRELFLIADAISIEVPEQLDSGLSLLPPGIPDDDWIGIPVEDALLELILEILDQIAAAHPTGVQGRNPVLNEESLLVGPVALFGGPAKVLQDEDLGGISVVGEVLRAVVADCLVHGHQLGDKASIAGIVDGEGTLEGGFASEGHVNSPDWGRSPRPPPRGTSVPCFADDLQVFLDKIINASPTIPTR